MDDERFDAFVRHLAVGKAPRRAVLRLLAGGALGAVATALRRFPAGAIAGCDSPCPCDKPYIVCNGSCIAYTDESCGCDGRACGECQRCSGFSCSPKSNNTPCGDGSRVCAGGVCCPSGWSNCSGTCADIQNDPQYCGSCAGCPSPQRCCDGTCADLRTDETHCGACDAEPCPDTWVCAACKGKLCTDKSVARCCPPAKRSNCNGTCVNRNTDEANCGRCGRKCGKGQACRRGECR